MHQYQTDDSVRANLIFTAVLLAVGLAYFFNTALQYFEIQLPWWFESPSILGFYGLIYWLYDKHLWKIGWIQKIDWVKTPNISGIWSAEIKTSHDGFSQSVSAKAIIRQTAFRISISMETDTSRSHSVQSALLKTDKVSEYELTYNYINHPKADSVKTLNIHLGTAHLHIGDNLQRMDGDYYTNRDRENFGRIVFIRA
ncbi:MAG: hypothetical protein HZB19_19180 [Chloroflexi bacterium]|nr:hypothetical protein [Chloroflexota bacterium]